MKIKRTNTTISFVLGITSILTIMTMFIIGIVNNWNLSPQVANLMGITLIGTMTLSIIGLVFFVVATKSSGMLKCYIAGGLNLTPAPRGMSPRGYTRYAGYATLRH